MIYGMLRPNLFVHFFKKIHKLYPFPQKLRLLRVDEPTVCNRGIQNTVNACALCMTLHILLGACIPLGHKIVFKDV